MGLHTWNHEMIETVVCELFGGNLGGKAAAASVNSTEIGLGRRGLVVGDVRCVDMKRRSNTVEAIEETVLVHMEVTRSDSPAGFPVFLGG